MGRYLVLFEVHLPFTYDPPNPGDALGGGLRGQGEHLATGKSVVEGCDSSLRPDAQVQAPLGRQTCSRHDIVQRTQPPSGKARVPNKAVVEDRKSTRLNSSHEWISYAVFCLKKKKKPKK